MQICKLLTDGVVPQYAKIPHVQNAYLRPSKCAQPQVELQEAAKQGGMKDEVAAQAMRHADRLIELAPNNPASYEFRAYTVMHSLAPAFDSACM